MKSYSVTIQMKATEQYFPVVLFIMQHKVVLTFECVGEILRVNAFQHSTSHQYQPLSSSLAAHAMASSLLVPTFPDLLPHPGPYQHLLTPSALLNPKKTKQNKTKQKIRQKFIIYFLEVGSIANGCLHRFIKHIVTNKTF